MEYNHDDYTIRFARPEDLEALIQVEAECFPAAEAAGRESFQARLEIFPDSFLVAELADGGRIIGFINGAVTDARTISDDMFEKADLHNANGAYQSIFGLDVVEAFRRRGVAAALMNRMIETARERGKKGLILTCKDRLIHYYEKFGYVNLGLSQSVHGGAVWYDMILEF
ncbi:MULTISPECIES: GNAT family N-acetyltransferase [Enterocloster]|uniref:Ribosomal protein S18 acetylase RimI n=1 Tax=Enterocloster lavalensis TaxID=460384 RepID=A0A1I0G1Z0_9FIRM|nr:MULTISPECIES: GNAT family N-acetyltransferase [Enterocloster]MDR3758987.1 GNAT family N-acetyltransferase [Enterocloster sp.]PST31435.1 N-acetyltransferase [Enterocloster lavalensis]SET64855.1 Ribosomal protein S18 acetylase RimI [Enterocloster lavalensis]